MTTSRKMGTEVELNDRESNENHQRLQEHNGRVGSILFLVMIVFLITLINPKMGSDRQRINELGIQKAKVIAYQIYQIYNRQLQSGRGPASVQSETAAGQMGTDPWGQSFRYRLIFNEKVNKRKIIVWSMGANGKVDTPLLANEDQFIKEVNYLGDDFGFELQMLN